MLNLILKDLLMFMNRMFSFECCLKINIKKSVNARTKMKDTPKRLFYLLMRLSDLLGTNIDLRFLRCWCRTLLCILKKNQNH